MRIFADLAYRGAAFHGWQIQPHDISVQETVENALSRILRRRVTVTGAGRTDTGVNASRMIAHFDLEESEALKIFGQSGTAKTQEEKSGITFASYPPAMPQDGYQSFMRSLNSLCGRDISIYSLAKVCDNAHARFDACERVYRYFITADKNPFIGPMAMKMASLPDFNRMNSAARRLLGVRDFTSFSKLHSGAKTNICDLHTAQWREVAGLPGLWCFEISADRFLRNMVRAVTGTLIEVGRGARPEEWISEVLEARDRCAAGTSLPGEPLFLHDIIYPSEIYTPPGRHYGLGLN